MRARDYIDATGQWKKDYAIAPRFTPAWLKTSSDEIDWSTRLSEGEEPPAVVEIAFPSLDDDSDPQSDPPVKLFCFREKQWRENLLQPTSVKKGYRGHRDTSWREREWTPILEAVGIQHEGSPVAWYDLDNGFVRYATLWDLAHLKQGVPQEILEGERFEAALPPEVVMTINPLWLLSQAQWDEAEFPPPIQGGPPFARGVTAGEAREARDQNEYRTRLFVAPHATPKWLHADHYDMLGVPFVEVEASGFQSAKKKREPKKIDIDNEDDVIAEMAKALDVDANDLTIASGGRYGNYDGSAGTVWQVDLGDREYFVVADHEVAEAYAIARVAEDLQDQPEMFNKDFLERHINTEKLAEALHSDVLEQRRESLTEADASEFWEDAEGSGISMYIPEEDEDGERRDPTTEEIDELAEALTNEQLKDPMQYLEDIYGRDDASKHAIEIAGIDIDAASKEAVRDDGPGHYLSSYDGDTHETPGRFTYWRQS